MADAFRRQGWVVTITPDGADGGVDLVLLRPTERVLVQCKHWNVYKVGVKVVRELYGVVAAQRATGGIVVTSGRYTEEARAFGSGAGIQLLDRDDVASMLGMPAIPPRQAQGFAVAGADVAGHASGAALPRCPRCGELMLIRTAQRGKKLGEQFWGCPRYPTCRGTIAVSPRPTEYPGAGAGPRPATGRPVASQPRSRARNRRWSSVVLGMMGAAAAAMLIPLVLIPVMVGAITQPLQRAATAAPRVPSAPAAGNPWLPRGSAAPDSRVVGTIPVAAPPHQLAVNPVNQRLYVTHVEDPALTLVDLAAGRVVSTLPLAHQPRGIAFDTKTNTVWVTHFNDGLVTVLDANGATLTTIQVGQGPLSVAVDPGLGRAYSLNSVDKTVSTIDTTTHKVTATKNLSWLPGPAVVDPVSHELCIVNTQGMSMWYCYDSSYKFVGLRGPGGDAIALDTVTHSRYSVRAGTRTLRMADGITNKETSLVIGQAPTGVAVDPSSHLVYVADYDATNITIVRPTP